ncbi:MAG: hypothetical protein LC790_22185, partial [Actinobacteria bacterium]|nr:hypothetical protein [Actinomycetota bacterium]
MTDDRDESAVIESTASEESEVTAAQPPDPAPAQCERSGEAVGALVPAPTRRASGTLMPLPADQVVEGMRAYQRLLRDLLEPSDWQTDGKHGNALEKPFLKKSGWRKIARAFNLSFERVHSQVERESDGSAVRAEVWIRAVAPNGQYGDGDGYCSADEGRFKSWKGRQKLENDLRATATTRAKNRAIADLVGMGEVSAEEIVPAGEQEEHEHALAAGARASEALAQQAFGALAELLGAGRPDREGARRVGERIAADHGYLPVAVGRALCYAATMRAGRSAEKPVKAAEPATAVEPTAVVSNAPAVKRSHGEALVYWQHKGRYPEELVASLAALLCGDGPFEALRPEQMGEVAFMLECAVRGKVCGRSLESWLARLAESDDRPGAAEALRARLVEKANEVE